MLTQHSQQLTGSFLFSSEGERETSSTHPLHLWLMDFFASRNSLGLHLVPFTCSAAQEASFR